MAARAEEVHTLNPMSVFKGKPGFRRCNSVPPTSGVYPQIPAPHRLRSWGPQEKGGLVRELEDLIGQMEHLVAEKAAAEAAAAAAHAATTELSRRLAAAQEAAAADLEAERAEFDQLRREVTLNPKP